MSDADWPPLRPAVRELLILGPPGTPPAVRLAADTAEALRDAIERALEVAEVLQQRVDLCDDAGVRLTVDEAAARVWRLPRAG